MCTDLLATVHSTRGENHPGASRILFAEDDADARSAMRLLLENDGYRVTTARDGAEAYERLASEPFDLVITDGNMPRLDGSGLVRKIRKSGYNLPIVMISAGVGEGKVEADVAGELSAALPKPCEAQEVRFAIAESLRVTDSGADPSNREPVVLVVEPARHSCSAFVAQLRSMGCRVLTATSHWDVFCHLRREPIIHVLLLDSMLRSEEALAITSDFAAICPTSSSGMIPAGGRTGASDAAREVANEARRLLRMRGLPAFFGRSHARDRNPGPRRLESGTPEEIRLAAKKTRVTLSRLHAALDAILTDRERSIDVIESSRVLLRKILETSLATSCEISCRRR